ncbi:phosphate ABC transporter substrate-binding/OmpA family protein [Fibrobacterales bacterium]|nr:phosphate ABC transporter substrate-binding/OmpA family protein [Fibrobacterales bacterium]
MKKKWLNKLTGISIALSLFNLGACEGGHKQPDQNTNLKIETPRPAPILKIHGSNTIGASLMDKLISHWLIKQDADSIRIEKGQTIEEKYVLANLNGKPVSVEIHSYGSSTGFEDLFWGKTDIAMSSKPIPQKSIKKLSNLGDMKSASAEHILSLDGISIIVHPTSPLKSIEIPTIKKIFSGEIVDWSEVNPEMSGPIEIIRRDNKSGTHEVFTKLVMEKSKIHENAQICIDNKELSAKVSQNPLAIGYTSVTFTGNNHSLDIKTQNNQLFKASKFNVQTEDYPLSRRLFLYTPEIPQNQLVADFIQFALSRTGQQVVEKNGFVAQTLKLVKPEQNTDASTFYKQSTQKSLRLSMNFRFYPRTSILDNRSQRDMERLVKFVKEENLNTCQVQFYGFSDNLGKKLNNKQLSYNRADQVAQVFQSKIKVPSVRTLGFGSEMPVANNNTLEGRSKNRRVEVWMNCEA